MMRTPFPRLAALALLVAGLSACGFHLRNRIALPPDLGPIKVTSTSRYSPLAESVARGLQAGGATLADEKATKVAALKILSERWGDRPIAIDELGRAQEYNLRYAAVFTLLHADGSELVPQQVVELSRDYITPPSDTTGTDTEREVLANELRREMAASILRRVDSVLQSGALQSGPSAPPGQAAAPEAAAPSEAAPPVQPEP
ncbi:MAG: LPS assembly lipoprotein LptE [Pseudoxanthomonas sp.]